MPLFSDLGLSAPILGALAAGGYETPTPIQLRAIPPVLEGHDLCGIAQTGTGKTAAFALPILERLAAVPRRAAPYTCRVLVLSPTRELASQIAESFRVYGAGIPLSTAVVFGGVPIGPQRQKLARGVDILVATPRRMLDLIDTRSLTLPHVQVLVLDEADRMLDLGFIHALKRIVKLLPRQRRTLLFSATMPRPIALLGAIPVACQHRIPARRAAHRRFTSGIPGVARRQPNLGGRSPRRTARPLRCDPVWCCPLNANSKEPCDMLIAREGEKIVCLKGTVCGRITRDANDKITDGDFAVLETCISPDRQRYVCACCERTVAVREHFRWRVHLRRGWVR